MMDIKSYFTATYN